MNNVLINIFLIFTAAGVRVPEQGIGGGAGGGVRAQRRGVGAGGRGGGRAAAGRQDRAPALLPPQEIGRTRAASHHAVTAGK